MSDPGTGVKVKYVSPLAQQVEYYHLDALGSVRAVTDATGAIVVRHEYEPYGREWNEPSPSDARRFTGKEREPETGWDYFGARYFSAPIARFPTVDPVRTWRENLANPERWNQYSYGRNNPLRYVDPDGKVTLELQDFKVYLGSAGDFDLEGRGCLVPAVAALAAVGSGAYDNVLANTCP